MQITCQTTDFWLPKHPPMPSIKSPSLKQAAVTRRLPRLPVAVKHGIGVSLGSRIFVGLGSGGRAWMCLDLADRRSSWQSLSEFPGLPRDQALALAIGEEIYVFGGAGYDPQVKRFRTFEEIHRYDTRTDAWTVCAATSPVPLLGAVIARRGPDAALFCGGVHDAVFNGFFKASAGATGDQLDDIVRQYLGMSADQYRFSSTVHQYEPLLERWTTLGEWSGQPCVGSALAQRGDDVYLMGGEIKPGLRSTQVHRLQANAESLVCERLADLPADTPGVDPEGLAGAMSIFNGDNLVLAGGTSFPGAKARYLQGKRYAHEDLSKHWRREILVFEKSAWRLIGKLPCGLAHAQIFCWDDEVVIVGGESDGGEARADVLTLTWEEAAWNGD